MWIRSPTPERIPGGRASGRPPIFVDPWQVQQGIAVEMEHTRDPRMAYEIAVDHLYEIPDYYTRLQQMERAAGLNGLGLSRRTALVSAILGVLGGAVALGLAIYEQRRS